MKYSIIYKLYINIIYEILFQTFFLYLQYFFVIKITKCFNKNISQSHYQKYYNFIFIFNFSLLMCKRDSNRKDYNLYDYYLS